MFDKRSVKDCWFSEDRHAIHSHSCKVEGRYVSTKIPNNKNEVSKSPHPHAFTYQQKTESIVVSQCCQDPR